MKQYELLFARNEAAQKIRLNLIQISLVAIGAFYSTVMSVNSGIDFSGALRLVLWLPVLMGVVGGLMTYTLRQGMRERGKVMLRIEREYDFVGWEGESRFVEQAWYKSSPNFHMSLLYWLLVSSLSAVIAVSGNLPS